MELEALTDEALVERIRDGDAAACHVLTERYSSRLRGQIEQRLSPAVSRRVSASDILQEAHLVALQRYGEFEDRGDGSFGAWFRKIVDNKVRKAVQQHAGAEKRAVGHEVTRSARRATGAFPSRSPSPSQVAIGEELREAARKAMSELPDHFREVLEVLQHERLTLDETARRMGRSREAVKKLYVRALARLEQLLEIAPDENGGRRRPTR